MSRIVFEDCEIPETCGKCEHIGRYEASPYARNPHCCCELIWQLKKEEYRVNKNSLDKNCPLKIGSLEM